MKNTRRDFLASIGLAGLGVAGTGITSAGPLAPPAHKEASLDEEEIGDLRLLDWEPVSQMVVKTTEVRTPRFPVIDMHQYMGDHLENMEYYLEQMDEAGVWKVVSMDGHSAGDFYEEHLRVSQRVATERMLVAFAPDFSKIDEPGFGQREAEKLEEAVELGCCGLKIFKDLGLTLRDESGEVVPVDDPRIDPIWAKCGELGIPVMIHVSDPKAFFTPVDRYNERYDELGANPDWSFYGDEYPEKDEILEQRNRVIERHPDTIFIATHMANLPEELGRVSMWLEKYPNMYVGINARISEIGRQPYTARKFMIRHQDRVLFSSATLPNIEAYQVYYRFLETDDEYIDPAPSHHLQGRWMIYGLHLPDEVLEKIYNKNALKLLGMNEMRSNRRVSD